MPNDGLEFAVHNVPPMVLLGPFLLAVGLYLLLRWVIRAPGGGTTSVTVSQHSLWIGAIGWLASSLQSAGSAGILPAGSTSPPLATPSSILGALAWPILGCLAVHAIGQMSYPGPQLPRRLASLGIRRIRDFLPRTLAWTVLAIFVGSAVHIGWVATLHGYEAIPFSTLSEGNQGFRRIGGDGRIQGSILAACLGAGWLALALGTAPGADADQPPEAAGGPGRGGERPAADHRHEQAPADRCDHRRRTGCDCGKLRGTA